MTFPELLAQWGVRYAEGGSHHHVRPGWVGFDCPRCSPQSGTFRGGWHLRGGYAFCWKCGRLDTLEVLGALGRIGEPEARRLLRELGVGAKRGETRAEPAVEGVFRPPPHLGPLLPAHLAYCESRGLGEKARVLWGLRGIGPRGDLRWRIWIPIRDGAGRDASWTTRSIVAREPMRYVSAPAASERWSHKSLLFGEEFVRGEAICAVEGPFDAMRVGPGAVACCGVAYTEAQLLRLSRYRVRGICFDADAGERARALAAQLEPFPGETILLTLDSAKDPAAASEKEVKQIRRVLAL